jgi:hypothetical protein
MTSAKETAIRLIQEIPDDKVIYLIDIINGINGLHAGPKTSSSSKQDAYQRLQQIRGQIPADLDYAEELSKSRLERYANTN